MRYFNKILSSIFFVFLLTPFYTQISITDNDLSNSGSNHVFSEILVDQSLNFKNTGANYSWDFSNVQYIKQDSLSNISVSSTPLLYQFYFNNFLLYPDYLASYALSGSDFSDPLGVLSLSNNYNYYKLSSSALNLVGFGTTVSFNSSPGLPTSVRYDTIDQIYPLPMIYGTTDSTSAYYLANIPSFGSYGQSIKRKVEVDGWGTLTTPYSNYDVLRVKTILYQVDTFYIDTFQVGNSINRPIVESYEWWAKNIGFPVLKVEYQNNLITNGWYADQLHVGFGDFNYDDLLLYPNPTEGELIIKTNLSENNFIYFSVYNILGSQVFKGKTRNKISLSMVPSGFYFIELNINNQSKVLKIQKI
tara:strand:- start:6774 stop:7853 length:1080 start_codon:yes stop_codon:yes gene_type:complete